MSQPKPIIVGRNFIETLILTLTQYELVNPNIEVRERVTQRLEEELCALGYSIPFVVNSYRQTVARIIEQQFPDLPKPDLKGCFLYEQVLTWLNRHRVQIFEKQIEVLHLRDVDLKIKMIAVRIIRSAIMSVLYKCAIVSVKT